MRRQNVLNISLLLVNPILSFISSLLDMIRLKDACFVFAFSTAIIAVYFPLMYDTSSNFFLYYSNYLDSYSPYIAIPLFFKNNFGIDFYYFIFFTVFFILFTWSKILVSIFSENKIKNSSLFLFLLVLFTFNYRDLLDLNRCLFAFTFFFYYLFLIKNKNIFNFLFFSILASLFHSASLIIIILYLLSILNFGYKINLIFLIFSIVMGILLPSLIFRVESIINSIPIFGNALNYYVFGDEFGVQKFSTGTLLKKVLNSSFIVMSCFFAIISIKNNGKDQILQFLIFLGCCAMFFVSFVTFFERINLAFNFIFVYLFFKNISILSKWLLVSIIFFKSIAVYTLIYIPIFLGDHSIVIDNSVKNDLILKPFYYPTIFLLDIHNNGYSDDIISKYSVWKN